MRTCGHPRRRDGEPCESTALGDDGLCSIHGGRVDPAEAGRAGGIASGETRREQAKSVRDRLREKVEEDAELLWDAFEDGLTAVLPNGAPDGRTRFAAAQAVLAEAYGRPPQAVGVAVAGPGGGPIEIDVPAESVRQALEILAKQGALDGALELVAAEIEEGADDALEAAA